MNKNAIANAMIKMNKEKKELLYYIGYIFVCIIPWIELSKNGETELFYYLFIIQVSIQIMVLLSILLRK